MPLRFDLRDPYPLVPAHSHTLAEAKIHSHQVDQWLGLGVESVEQSLCAHGCRERAASSNRERQNLWIGLAAQNLLTPYVELRRLLEDLNLRPGSTVIDLGAGYGRMGFIIGRHFSKTHFIGYEYVGERVKEARRALMHAHCPNVTVEHRDIADRHFLIPPAEFYFIYDYGSPAAVEKTLYDLKRVAAKKAIVVIVRGRAREVVAWHHSWLKIKADVGYSGIYDSVGAESALKERLEEGKT